MEWRIGEIFEHNGEWYQCIGDPYNECTDCDFCFETGKACVRQIVGQCSMSNRSDGLSVAFKRLEKVGEPYINNDRTYQLYKLPMNIEKPSQQNDGINFVRFDIVEIEIKQTKEDTMEETKLNIKPFSLEAAKAGKPVCTRDGRKARIICFDGKGDQPIIALVEAKGNKDALIENVERYFINGHSIFEVRETNNDLMMLPEKKEGWVNVYRDCDGANITKDDNIYSSKEAAMASAQIIDGNSYVATTKINWEEQP